MFQHMLLLHGLTVCLQLACGCTQLTHGQHSAKNDGPLAQDHQCVCNWPCAGPCVGHLWQTKGPSFSAVCGPCVSPLCGPDLGHTNFAMWDWCSSVFRYVMDYDCTIRNGTASRATLGHPWFWFQEGNKQQQSISSSSLLIVVIIKLNKVCLFLYNHSLAQIDGSQCHSKIDDMDKSNIWIRVCSVPLPQVYKIKHLSTPCAFTHVCKRMDRSKE